MSSVRAAGLPPRAAPAASTCPWGPSSQDDIKAARPRLNNQASRNTCPWGSGAEEVSKGKSKAGSGYTSSTATSPWTGDEIASRLDNAVQRMQQKPMAHGHNAFESDAVPAQREISLESDRFRDAAWPVFETDAAPAQLDWAPAPPKAQELGSDPDAEERQRLIEQSLSYGLTDDQINEVLEEHMNKKVLQTLHPQEWATDYHEADHLPDYIAKPEEITNKKSLQTLHSQPEVPTSIAAKRAASKEASTAVVGGFNSRGSSVAFRDNHQQAAAAKLRNSGSGIF